MVYRIKFISDEAEGFLREIKIDSESTFLDLNKAILKSCGYPDDQMTSFYICDEEWERGTQVTREDMGFGSSDVDIYVMENTRLSELIEDDDQRMEFVFDPFSDRFFYLEVRETIPGKNLAEAVVSRTKGDAPCQLAELDFDLSSSKGKKGAGGASGYDDFGDDSLFGAAGYNDDEIDWEGFEISDGNPYK